jgi:hypothetical protein
MGIVGSANAQAPNMPYPPPQRAMPEPIPFSGTPLGEAPPPAGMMPMQGVPQDTANSLPAGIANAWSQDPPYSPAAGYATLGYMGLFRQALGHGAAVALDSASGGVDTGIGPTGATPVIGDFHNVSPGYMSGVNATLGYHSGTEAFEVSGFYMSQSSDTKTFASPGGLDSYFNVGGSFINAPLGFEGDNGMWLQADVMRIQFKTAVGNGEANYRWWLGKESDFSWSLGVRFLDIYERLGFYSGDDDTTVLDSAGNPDPTRQATYTVTTQNRILAPQLGFQWEKAINSYLAFNLMVKGAWGANFREVDTLLQRGDGFVGFSTSRNDTIFSQLYEMGFNLDIYLAERARLRMGYQVLWVVDVSEAIGQFDYNLANPKGTTNNDGSIFYHGPMVELQIVF